MRIEIPRSLVIGLFVRDAADLRVETEFDVPPLAPAVERRALLAPLATAVASEQWARWWEQELARPPGQGPFAPDPRFGDGPELVDLVRACFDDASRWGTARHSEEAEAHRRGEHPDHEGDLVRAVEAETGRKARPFDLRVSELPVAGAFGQRVSATHVLVSRTLRADAEAYGELLTPVIRELA
jgi:hypothetical protein